MVNPNDELPSVRGLIDSDMGPLRRFTAVLDSMPRETKTYGEGENARNSVRISLNYKQLEVIEAIEPYQFPITTIVLTLSNRKKSKYGVFGMSLAEILDQQYSEVQRDPSSPEYVKPSDRQDLKDCIEKRMGLVLADGEDGRPDKHMLYDGRAIDETHPKGQDVPTAVWEVYMVEGVGVRGEEGINPTDKAMELLDGKALKDFNAAAMADDLIRGDIDLLQSIGMPPSAENSFTNVMVSTGKFTKDDQDIFHKVE